MKRTFYLVITVLRNHSNMRELELIRTIFPGSDVQEHLANKLFTYSNRNPNFYTSLLDFYEGLDNEHQLLFDLWMDKQMNELNQRTIPHEL